MISTVEEKAIDNIIEVIEPLLSQNEKDKPMYGTITEECDDVKKVMGDVGPFKPDYQTMEKVSIVDAEVKYACQYTGMMYILVFRNFLSVPIMDNNLFLPLITRKEGLVVKDTVNINAADPSVEGHIIYFPRFNFFLCCFCMVHSHTS